MTKISLVVAMTPMGIIGNNNQLLWHLPNDLKHFKALTVGKPIIMGRKTYESIGKPLPGRHNIILTRHHLKIAGCDIVHSVTEALTAAEVGKIPEIMVIGGGEIYRIFEPLAHCIYITYVDVALIGDTQFVAIDNGKWKEIARENFSADEKHAYAYSFVTLSRLSE